MQSRVISNEGKITKFNCVSNNKKRQSLDQKKFSNQQQGKVKPQSATVSPSNQNQKITKIIENKMKKENYLALFKTIPDQKVDEQHNLDKLSPISPSDIPAVLLNSRLPEIGVSPKTLIAMTRLKETRPLI